MYLIYKVYQLRGDLLVKYNNLALQMHYKTKKKTTWQYAGEV